MGDTRYRLGIGEENKRLIFNAEKLTPKARSIKEEEGYKSDQVVAVRRPRSRVS